jgi:hypothetical protein
MTCNTERGKYIPYFIQTNNANIALKCGMMGLNMKVYMRRGKNTAWENMYALLKLILVAIAN